MTGRSWLAASGAVALAITVAACANLPTGGAVDVNKLHGAGGSGQLGSEVVPRGPVKGWRPQDIVSGFLTASATYGYDPSHAIARKYLTDGKHGFERRWRPGWAATIIDTPKYTPEPSSPLGTHAEQGNAPQSAQVQVTGRHLASLETAGRYQAGSVVVEPQMTKYHFVLIQVAGQWRINNIYVNDKPAKPTLLLLTRLDFEREYQSRNLYFYPPGPATTTLVPDPVFIPAQVGEQGISGLVRTLINPPLNSSGSSANSDSSWLFGATETAFPAGTKLLSAQVVGGVTAVVNLGGTAKKASQEQRQRMAAELYLSLTQSPYPSQEADEISSVVLKVAGHTVRTPSQGYLPWLPRSPGGPLYYQIPGSSAGPAVAALRARPSQTASLQLPKALAGETFTSMAVSTAATGSAVLAGCRGKHIYLMPQSHVGQVISQTLPDPCTSLSWDELGDLWIATGQSGVFVVSGAGSRPPAKLALTGVLGPALGKSSIAAMRVAPDGVRVALLLKSKSGARIRIGAISKAPQYIYLAQALQMLRVGTDVPDPIGLTWLDADHLLVLSRTSPTRTQLYDVPLNGAQSTLVPTPPGAVSVAASLPGGQFEPLLAVGIAPTVTTPGKIETAKTGLLNPDWHQVAKGITPVFPG